MKGTRISDTGGEEEDKRDWKGSLTSLRGGKRADVNGEVLHLGGGERERGERHGDQGRAHHVGDDL